MWTRRRIDDELDNDQKLAPVITDGLDDIQQQNTKNLLHFLVNSLDARLFHWPPRRTKPVSHAHEGCELFHKQIGKLRPSI